MRRYADFVAFSLVSADSKFTFANTSACAITTVGISTLVNTSWQIIKNNQV